MKKTVEKILEFFRQMWKETENNDIYADVYFTDI